MPRKRTRKVRRPLLAVLSRKRSLYSTRRLVEAARAHGMRTRILDVLACNLVLERGRPRLFVAGEELKDVAVAIPRIGASVTAAGLAVGRQLETQGGRMVNGATGIANSRDKLRALQLLAEARIDVPRTVLARGGGDIKELVAHVGGLPAILKLIQGTQGVGVMIAHSEAEVESILSTLWDLGQEILLQEFIAESRGRDVRALVVGDRVAGAMRREARSGEFRSNLHRGGEGSALELSAEYAQAAVRAARDRRRRRGRHRRLRRSPVCWPGARRGSLSLARPVAGRIEQERTLYGAIPPSTRRCAPTRKSLAAGPLLWRHWLHGDPHRPGPRLPVPPAGRKRARPGRAGALPRRALLVVLPGGCPPRSAPRRIRPLGALDLQALCAAAGEPAARQEAALASRPAL